jgi:hypothetical protein
VPVGAILLGQHSANNEEVAENASASLGCGTFPGKGRHVSRSFTDGSEQVEIDGGFQGGGALMGLEHLEDQRWGQRSFISFHWVHTAIFSPPRRFAVWREA